MDSTFERHGSEIEVKERVVSIFDMFEDKAQGFKERIESARGRIFLFVHPYTAEVDPQASSPHEKNVTNVKKGMDVVMRGQDGKVPPLFIMEGGRGKEGDRDVVRILNERLGGYASGDVCVIPTKNVNDPEPEIPNGESLDPQRRWMSLMDRFRKLGIRHIILGGMNMWDRDMIRPQVGDFHECLGVVAKELSLWFVVDISNFTAPDKRPTLGSRDVPPPDIYA